MRVRLTREGLRFAVLLAVVAFAAYNTHNNLIFLVLSVGIAAVAVGFSNGLLAMRGLSLQASDIPDVHAGIPFAERLRLTNGSSFVHGFGISVEGGASRVGLLRRGDSTTCAVTRLLRERGLHRGAPVHLASGFPFGLFRFERRFETPRDILVFPEVRPIDPTVLAAPGQGGAGSGGRPGGGDEFFRLRHYESGDPVHHVHWRTTAKVGELMVRELGDSQEERLAVTFEPSLDESAAPEDFERVVTATASIARYLSDRGASFRFFSQALDLPPRPSREHLRAVLTHLALVAPIEAPAVVWRARLERARAHGDTVLVVTADVRRLSGLAGGAVRLVSPERLLREGSSQ